MSEGTVEIPIEVWEHCQRDAERMAYLHKECIKLQSENERLRDAGDELYLICQVLTKDKSEIARKGWYNAKKEGRDAK
jgi:hypothetical protein